MTLSDPPLGEHLAHQASRLGAHAIVIGPHQRSGWKRLWEGSVTTDALSHLDTSVVCVPNGA